ncbi:Alpha/Beta hydrolase protein [Paraphoma chrysanthemicola]|uniref:Alpha/Beta hydrolase protein n=1 Tax=Paraphoma chrysanthemicola TaxID=798071 RepID=A0A8K0QRW7_9PLEO|nr:Alpha/Beta hydrolase protein [Paraphoma chrysanthemicola]
MSSPQSTKLTPQSIHHNIWFTTAGTSSKPTLLLLHGIFNSHREFHQVSRCLEEDFFIILVDLPGHSRSRSPHINHYDIPKIASELATLVQDISPTKKAHIAGVSYGGFIGLELARSHPEVVESLFESGGAPFGFQQRGLVCQPFKVFLMMKVSMLLPDWLYYFMQGLAGVPKDSVLRRESKKNCTLSLVKTGFGSCLNMTMTKMEEIKGVRVLAIAGGKQDNVDMTQQLGRALQMSSGCKDKARSKAVVVQKAIHGWDDQFPDLFASGIKAWVTGSDLPIEFEELE